MLVQPVIVRAPRLNRRRFIAAGGAGLALASSFPMPGLSQAAARPVFTHGVQSGDVSADAGVVWIRPDRPSRVTLEWATTESFANPVRVHAIDALPESDLAVKRLLTGLPPDQDIFFRMVAADLQDINVVSEPITGHFRTAPAGRRSVRFTWSGDTAGQGWGIDAEGMRTYATMLRHEPDFFIHSGDTVYADGPMEETVALPDGGTWRNVVLTDEKRKVAESLDEFRGQWKYNLLDEHVRAFNAQVPTFFQWDDHEVVNNWSPSKDLTGDERYEVKSVPLLAARAARAFHEMTPISYLAAEPGRVYRKIGYGPLLDVFFLDLRSYRGPNTEGLQPELSPEARVLGREQVAWLQRALANSTATWKVIASDMPIGLKVWDTIDDDTRWVEAIANGDDGAPLGRELEIAEILRFIKAAGIANTVWVTADVHYTAAHHYDPSRARFQDFDPFWEFVSGPIHAGTFGPNELDMTFGPEVRFVKAPEGGAVNLPPSAGLQFFGIAEIDGATEAMTVRLMDRADTALWSVTLEPVRRA